MKLILMVGFSDISGAVQVEDGTMMTDKLIVRKS